MYHGQIMTQNTIPRKALIPTYREAVSRVNHWLVDTYGPATKCESNICERLPSRGYQWVLLHGKIHAQKRENYIQLCIPCHQKYYTQSSVPDVEIDDIRLSGGSGKILSQRKQPGINVMISRRAHARISKAASTSKPRRTLREQINIDNKLPQGE